MTSPTPLPAIDEVPVRCQNCGEPLLGEHCYACGQPTKGLVRHFSSIVGDFMDSVFELDSRILRTLGPLLWRPGYLSSEYFAGRRVRYVSPVRLFVFLSLLAFFAAKLSFDINVDADGNSPVVFDTGDNTSTGIGRATTEPGQEDKISFNGTPWDPETNPVKIGALPDVANARLNAMAGDAEENIQRIRKDPNLLKDAFLSNVPTTLFVLLPLFALLLKLAYLFQRRIYMEHLIVALHSHSFLCAGLLLVLLLDALAGWSSAMPWVSRPLGWIEIAVIAWLPIYLLLMQKRVYGQGWIMTLLKYGVLGTCYFVLVSLGATLSLLVSLVNM
jgi:hypothetical protein